MNICWEEESQIEMWLDHVYRPTEQLTGQISFFIKCPQNVFKVKRYMCKTTSHLVIVGTLAVW